MFNGSCLQRICFVCFFLVVGTFRNGSAQDDLLSRATGYLGLRALSQQPPLQQRFDLSSQQVLDLQKLVNQQRWEDEIKKAYNNEAIASFAASMIGLSKPMEENGISFGFDAPHAGLNDPVQTLAFRSIDRMIRPEAAKILSKEQLNGIRIHYLRQRFPYPSSILGPATFQDLGFTKSEIESIIDRRAFREIVDARSASLRNAYTKVSEIVSADSKVRLVRLLGNETFPGLSAQKVGDPVELELTPETKPCSQIRLMGGIVMPIKYLYSEEQSEKLRKLRSQDDVRFARDPASRNDASIRRELSGILTLEQRVYLVQALHRQIIENDFNLIAKKEIADYLQVTGEQLSNLKDEAFYWQTVITDEREDAQRKLYENALKRMAPEKVKLIKELFDGVWL